MATIFELYLAKVPEKLRIQRERDAKAAKNYARLAGTVQGRVIRPIRKAA